MEPKVVQKCLASEKKTVEDGFSWDYDAQQTFYKQGGSGNNWALGYSYLGEEEYVRIKELLSSQLEKIDYFGGFQVLQSLAGGTGSGLGAHLVERLREDFAKTNLLCTAVWPYMHGEVVLQNYNVLLTLSRLTLDCSGLITIFNDEILQTCRDLLKNPRPSYSVLNRVIAQQMASVFFPAANTDKAKAPLWTVDSNQMLQINQTLCCRSQYKLLQLK